jgi:hypothetical protein
MLTNKKIQVIAATDKKVYFTPGGDSIRNNAAAELPLAQFLSNEYDPRLLSIFQETRTKILLIVPDHWFKHEFHLFKSQRESLIRPFIERKLKAAYPNLPLAQHLFNYSWRQKAIEGPGVRVFHLYEPVSCELYEALARANLTPRWVSTPALLWEERFNLQLPEFATQAALVIHLHPHEASLYFYAQGDFLFSRSVALPESDERWDALLFEVNQSIYLFSQKAKTDLNKIYLIGKEPSFQDRLSDFLSRPVQAVPATAAATALPRELAALEGLLEANGASAPGDAHSLTHRRIQQALKWRPVQWTGMLVAAMLLVFFIGEQQWLQERLMDEISARSRMRQQQPMALADYDAALVELTEDAKRPSAAHAVLNIVSSLPEEVLINEVKMDSDALRLDLAATVAADTVDRFRQVLKSMIENLNRRLHLSPPITIEDMTFNMEEMKTASAKAHYKIACKINLP